MRCGVDIQFGSFLRMGVHFLLWIHSRSCLPMVYCSMSLHFHRSWRRFNEKG